MGAGVCCGLKELVPSVKEMQLSLLFWGSGLYGFRTLRMNVDSSLRVAQTAPSPTETKGLQLPASSVQYSILSCILVENIVIYQNMREYTIVYFPKTTDTVLQSLSGH